MSLKTNHSHQIFWHVYICCWFVILMSEQKVFCEYEDLLGYCCLDIRKMHTGSQLCSAILLWTTYSWFHINGTQTFLLWTSKKRTCNIEAILVPMWLLRQVSFLCTSNVWCESRYYFLLLSSSSFLWKSRIFRYLSIRF